jgi:hypothetical protein
LVRLVGHCVGELDELGVEVLLGLVVLGEGVLGGFHGFFLGAQCVRLVGDCVAERGELGAELVLRVGVLGEGVLGGFHGFLGALGGGLVVLDVVGALGDGGLEVLGVADKEGEVGFFEEVGSHCG